MHGDDDAWSDLLYSPVKIFEFDSRWSSGQGQEDVCPPPQPSQLIFGEGIAQIPQVQDAYTFQLEAVDGILVRAFLALQTLHGRQGLECHTVHLYRPPARNLQGVQDLRIA